MAALSTPVRHSTRTKLVEGMFDVPPQDKQGFEIEIPPDLERLAATGEWGIGLVVGPSGAGKTTLARELADSAGFAYLGPEGLAWDPELALIDQIEGGVRDAAGMLTAVGLGSPPAWLRPFHALSTGEQFRATVARALAGSQALVVDEFTSVVDRQVAKVASHAVAKTVRREGKQLVAVTCHYDVVDWLQPDWVYRPDSGHFERRERLRRPSVELAVHQVARDTWAPFSRHHYLSPLLHGAAWCYGAFVGDEQVAFNAVIPFPHAHVKDIKMGHRLVVLPDWQGLGIGLQFDNWLGAELDRMGYRYHKTISHPALIAALSRSERWALIAHSNRPNRTGAKRLHKTSGNLRKLATRSFRYVPEGVSIGSRVTSTGGVGSGTA